MQPVRQLSAPSALTNPCLSVRLLIVEDEPRLLRSLTGALEDEGYQVDTAADGIEGASKAETTNYDAIILDLMLPGLDGWQVLGRVRRTQRTPVLMLSARDTKEDRAKSFDCGAHDYLAKPFELNELFARLRALVPPAV